MKKRILILTLCVIVMASLGLTACSNNEPALAEENNTAAQSDDEEKTVSKDAKSLVVYFSVPDNEDNSYVEKDGERLGNTQYMAQVIQEEIRTDARPEIEGTIENFDSYDVVFVGYPNWNADMPYIMYSFFETYDFSGKTIIPFMTHGGSGFSGTPETIAELEPGADMLSGKEISRNSIEGTEQEIIDWIEEIGLLKN